MEERLFKMMEDSLQAGMSKEELLSLVATSRPIKTKRNRPPFNYKKWSFVALLLTVLYALKNPRSYQKPWTHLEELREAYLVTPSDRCILDHNHVSMNLFRKPSNCTICSNVTHVPVVYNLTQQHFLKHHAYTGVPVLAKGYANHWSALKQFSYKYFKQVYNETNDDKDKDFECQFFPYKTNFVVLDQVWQMSKKRAKMKKDQWYIGWSICIPRIQKTFRKHYSRPTFLPKDSESSATDWIFMGGHGNGASIHVDSVNRPSWQAQVTGKKTWTLEPPPECESMCKRHLNATMEVGDILVVDTNYWYHGTYVHPGDMSITIGSEYD